MKLKELLREDFEVSGDLNISIDSVTFNSKEVTEGSLFISIVGQNTDGHNFIDEAIRAGTSSVVFNKERYRPENKNITWIGVKDTRDALAWISAKFYGEPSKELKLIGITGTNGKTTTSYLIREILKASEKKTGLIGTIRYLIDEEEIKAVHTTPESLHFQKLLREMVNRKVEYVISEVSSHALALKRVDYVWFDVAVFTNLSRDHLDFHSDMEDYFRAKSRLFLELLKPNGLSVINFDDQYGRRLADEVKGRKILYSLENSNADVYVKKYSLTFDGSELEIAIKNRETISFKTSLLGIPNIYNILSAISTAVALGIETENIKKGIEKAKAPEGRFESIREGQKFLVFVDYAHTPDALERLLLSVRRLREELKDHRISKEISIKGRIITLFGCGGNRDRGKRPLMGAIAAELSDLVILTSDNPRWESPRDIIREIEEGVRSDNYIVIPNREEALRIAVKICREGDILIVAGKGHEDYQEIEGKRYPFSDREVLRSALKELK